jgi:hypothetical protein
MSHLANLPVPPRPRPDGITLLAIWDFLVAAMTTLGLCAMCVALMAVMVAADDTGDGRLAGLLVLGTLITVLLMLGLAHAVTAWGLLQLKGWARSAAMTLAVLQLFGAPIGTIVGALSLVYLTGNAEARAAFTPGPRAPSAQPPAPPPPPGAPAPPSPPFGPGVQ